MLIVSHFNPDLSERRVVTIIPALTRPPKHFGRSLLQLVHVGPVRASVLAIGFRSLGEFGRFRTQDGASRGAAMWRRGLACLLLR